MNRKQRDIVEKWYRRLGFPSALDADFYSALDAVEIDEDIALDGYDLESTDGVKNLLQYLYFCEATERRYKELGIDEQIMLDTMQDIVIYTDVWTNEVKGGKLCLGELKWVKRTHELSLFNLGRLQYGFGKSTVEDEAGGIKKGENIIEIHIPRGKPLTPLACVESVKMANAFFAKYFPDYKYNFYTCSSWLLGREITRELRPESNIVKFASMFNISDRFYNTDDGLKYVFGWSATRENKDSFSDDNSLARLLKSKVDSGEPLTGGIGYFSKYEY